MSISLALWSWDVVEYLRSLSEEELLKVKRNATEPRVALHVTMATNKEDAEIRRCKDELMSQHLSSCLRRWMDWREGEQQRDQTIDANSSGELDHHTLVCKFFFSVLFLVCLCYDVMALYEPTKKKKKLL